MPVLTIREKNQVTVPQSVLDQAGLRTGDPIEFGALADGGVAMYPLGHLQRRQSAWDLAVELAAAPGLADVDPDLPPREIAVRDVAW